MQLIEHSESPRYIRLHDDDNVVVVVNDGGLGEGARFADGLTLVEDVPQSHKVATVPIAKGQAVRRYGQVIGYALEDLRQGSWVQEGQLAMPAPPELDDLPRCDAVPQPKPPLLGHTFEGYRNADGTVGTRNILGITTTVQCVTGVLEHAVKRIRNELLPRYPNVDDVVALTHSYGCGVAINARDAYIPIRTVRNLARNPNLGGEALVISLGCEKLQASQVMHEDDLSVDLSEPWLYRLQDASLGFTEMIEQIMALAETRLKKLDKRRRETVPASELILGMQCGGSDAFSGITANPALGYAADLLVRAGATVLFSEVTEVRDAIYMLTSRAQDPQVADALVREMDWYDRYLHQGAADRSANTTPGNKKGGLSNIVEKALGSIVKSGSGAIQGVLGPGERVNGKGLIFCATPASDFVCGTLQLAAGMNLHVFTTGRGTPYGLAMAPVVKVCTRTELAQRWPDLIDIDAGRIATGRSTIEALGWELFHYYLDVASGRKHTWAEQHRLHNDITLFNPAPIT
ncbi:UNVERIFIED_ORG: galactarate dehydratase [Pseudomonas parafulva]|uniref:Galactarate dehydratase n=1 Tax=Pseudomonas fulva TaxID=47880 RepID=A0A7S9L422_9PSED|nr:MULTISPECIES: galactarate dehydratase [Pseudomonas]MDP9557704.1 galactarate dehydratase [Pseudomonas parafulva]MBA1207961.1 galactarate dehydratase [Pseudomonas fulva]MBA1217134.1 galactarate dehydratase [Pseudomonas fulva]MBA1221752.1 galactarate dehydratase [Pseudomonas fulva]MBN4164669.1 galactarate dehydratase [Pseudomonas fulva]